MILIKREFIEQCFEDDSEFTEIGKDPFGSYLKIYPIKSDSRDKIIITTFYYRSMYNGLYGSNWIMSSSIDKNKFYFNNMMYEEKKYNIILYNYILYLFDVSSIAHSHDEVFLVNGKDEVFRILKKSFVKDVSDIDHKEIRLK